MKFYGSNEKECRWRLAHHLSHSNLHMLQDAEAIQMAELAKVDSYVESTIRSKRPRCDERVAILRPRTPSPPRPSTGDGNDMPRADRALLATIATIKKGERAVLKAEEIALVAAKAFADVASTDVEGAARKAEEISLVAARAVAEVAAKLVEIRGGEAGNADVD